MLNWPRYANVHITLRESSLNYSIIVHIFLSPACHSINGGRIFTSKKLYDTQQNEWISYSNCLPYQENEGETFGKQRRRNFSKKKKWQNLNWKNFIWTCEQFNTFSFIFHLSSLYRLKGHDRTNEYSHRIQSQTMCARKKREKRDKEEHEMCFQMEGV